MTDWIKFLEPDERFLFLLLYSKNRASVRGDIWLQKEMFLIGRNVKEIGEKYDNYLKGPFSERVATIEAQYERAAYITIDSSHKITLAERGLPIAEAVWNQSSDEDKRLAEDVKDFLNDMTYDELISYIYSSYPDTVDNSNIIELFKRVRVTAAISLFSKKKVSLEKAAHIAGLSLPDFVSNLKDRKEPIFQAGEGSLDTIAAHTHN